MGLLSILAEETNSTMNSNLFMGYLIAAIGVLIGIIAPIISIAITKSKNNKDDEKYRQQQLSDLQKAITESNSKLMTEITSKNESQTSELNKTNLALKDAINNSNTQLRETITKFNESNITVTTQLSENLKTLNGTIDALNGRMGRIEEQEQNTLRLLAKDKDRLDAHDKKLSDHDKKLKALGKHQNNGDDE